MKKPVHEEARSKIHGLIVAMRVKRLGGLKKKPMQLDDHPKDDADHEDMGKLKAMMEPGEPDADDEEKKGKRKPF